MAAGWLAGAPAASAAVTPSCVAAVCTVSFPAGAATTWVVPDSVTAVTATLAGGEGGGWSATPGDVGGAGGQVVATIPVTPGDTLTAVVGEAGSPAADPLSSASPAAYGGGGVPPCIDMTDMGSGISCGGGGGGGSFLFAATGPGAPRLLAVAGGGGAGGVGGVSGGDAGGVGGAGSGTAADGHAGQDASNSGAAGGGGTQTSGGAGSGAYFIGTDGGGPATAPNTLGTGGTSNGDARVGAGGGGYYGGGGSGSTEGGGYYGAAGGGSGFLIPDAVVNSTGTNSGAGTVKLTYPEPSATSTALHASPTAPTAGRSITLTATVTATLVGASKPSGTAEFFDGSTVLGQAAVTAGTATLSTTLTAGVHHLSVHYSGGNGFEPSTSPTITVTITTAATPTPTRSRVTTTPAPTHSGGTSTSTSPPSGGSTSNGAALAATGSPTQPMFGFGVLLLLGGAGALLAARRRQTRHH
jgi:hypothetical protein